MRVGFFVQDNGPESQVHFDIAKPMIESVRKFMPGVEVYQLTDGQSPAIEGVDGVERIDGHMPMAVRRITHHSQLVGDWLFIDSDIIFQQDVRDVFDSEFDIALTDRIGTSMEGTPYAKQMPYNMGVTFSRNPHFWGDVRRELIKLPARYQQWEGDQRVVCALAESNDILDRGYQIKILPGRIYNFPPDPGEDEPVHAAILHMKGQMKGLMRNQEVEVSEW